MFLERLYAAYGSNMSLKAMKERCPNAVVVGTGVMKDTGIVFRGCDRGFATLVDDVGCEVPIVLWRITALCEKALDDYEEYPVVYSKEIIHVDTDRGPVEAMAYLMTPEYAQIPVMPSVKYIGVIKDGYEDHGLDFGIYMDALDTIMAELGENEAVLQPQFCNADYKNYALK